jgi:hypothetical protein
MGDRYVSASGSNSSPYETWATAATSLATAAGAAAAGEKIYIDNAFSEAYEGATATITFATGVEVISTSDTTNSPPLTYAFGATIQAAQNGNFGITLTAGTGSASFRGIKFQGGPTRLNTFWNNGQNLLFNDCEWDISMSSATSVVQSRGGAFAHNVFQNCQFKWGNAGQSFNIVDARSTFISCDMSTGTVHPNTLFPTINANGSFIEMIGCDLSDIGQIFESVPATNCLHTLRQCSLKSGYTLMGSTLLGGGDVYAYDCAVGDSHIALHHENYFGSTKISTSIYVSDNIADSSLSWEVAGSANANAITPYESPWLSVYHSGTSAITPYLECVRSGSDVAYTEAQVWSEWTAKVTASSTQVTLYSNRASPLGTASNNEASSKTGTDWTGEDATSWFGKLQPNSTITPAEAGHISARICVAGNHTVYVDPQIRIA